MEFLILETSVCMVGKKGKKCLSKWLDFSKGFIARISSMQNRDK
jgi:hypothetical protein